MTRPRPVSQPDTVGGGGRSERTGHPRGFRDPTRPEPQSGRRSRSTPSFQQLLGLSTHCPPGREPVTAAPPPTGLPRMQEATLPLPAAGGHCLPQPADHGTPHCHGHGGPRPWQAALVLTRSHAVSRGLTRPHAASRCRTPSAVRAWAVGTCVLGAVAATCVLEAGAQGSADLAPGGDAVPGWPRPPPRCAHRAPPPPHEETA